MNLSEKLHSLAEDYQTQIRRNDFMESKINQLWKTSVNT